MAQTLIATKKTLLEFIDRNFRDDEVIVMTDSWTSAEAKKKGMTITMEFAKDTFKNEGGIHDMMKARKIMVWAGPRENVSADTLHLFLNEKKRRSKRLPNNKNANTWKK